MALANWTTPTVMDYFRHRIIELKMKGQMIEGNKNREALPK